MSKKQSTLPNNVTERRGQKPPPRFSPCCLETSAVVLMPLTDHAWSTPADPSHSSSQQWPPPRVVTKNKRTKGRKKNMADLAASLANRTAPKHKRYTPDVARNKWTKSGGASENGLWPDEGKSQRTTDMTTSLSPCVCTDGEAQGMQVQSICKDRAALCSCKHSRKRRG